MQYTCDRSYSFTYKDIYFTIVIRNGKIVWRQAEPAVFSFNLSSKVPYSTNWRNNIVAVITRDRVI